MTFAKPKNDYLLYFDYFSLETFCFPTASFTEATFTFKIVD